MKPNTYFIPININKLAHFFGRGIIVPSSYLNNAQQDIQNLFDTYILLSTEKFTTDTNCCIEVALSEDENPQSITDNFLLLNVPLAISRVVAVFFKNSEELANTKYNITRGDAFLPDFLLKVVSDKSIDTSELKEYKASENTENWHDKLKMYDQLMGGFSLMKISTEEGNYPEHYLKTLSNISNWFDNESKENLDKNIFSMFFSESSKPLHNKFKKLIYSRVTISEVESFAKEENVLINKAIGGGIDLNLINKESLTYILAILAIYNEDNGGSLSTSDFFYDFSSKKLNINRNEAISLAFGLNKGYSALPKDFLLEKISFNIKFKLDSKDDLYIVESIYQNVFNENIDYNPSKFIDTYGDYSIRDSVMDFKKTDKDSYDNSIELVSIEDNSKLAEKLLNSIKSPFSIIIDEFSSTKKIIYDHYNNLIKNMASLAADFNEKLEQESVKHSQKKTQLENQMNERITSLEADFDSKLKQESDKHNQEKANSERQILELNEHVASLAADFDEKLEQESTKHSQEKAQSENQMNERITSLEANFDIKFKQESDKHNQEKANSERQILELNEHVASLTADFDSKLEQQSAKHSQEKADSESQINELTERVVLEVDKYQNITDDQSQQKSNLEKNTPLSDTPSDLFEEELSIANKASREKELKSKKRSELNHLAEDIGLEFNQYNNKKLLIEAILSKELIKNNVN